MYARSHKAVSDLTVIHDQLLISVNKDLEIQKFYQKYCADLERIVYKTNAAITKSNEEKMSLVDQLNNIVSRWKSEDERACYNFLENGQFFRVASVLKSSVCLFH